MKAWCTTRILVAAALAWAIGAGGAIGTADAQAFRPGATKPAVPPPHVGSPGDDAVRVALVDSGVDYVLPSVNRALLRHRGGAADGMLVGIDFRELDHRPYDAQELGGGRVRRHGTGVASVLLREAPGVALVPYRYPGQDMRLMHALVEHAAAHGVRVMGLPLGSDRRAQWDAFEGAARAHPQVLFVASAGNDGRNLDARPLYPASLALDNLLVVSSADDFGRASPESGTGRTAVDYLVFAEAVPTLGFGGRSALEAGSSYAVPRVMALAARLLESDASLDAAGLIRAIRHEHGNGLRPSEVGEGLLIDPLADTVPTLDRVKLERGPSLRAAVREAASGRTASAAVSAEARLDASSSEPTDMPIDRPLDRPLDVPLDVYVLDPGWTPERLRRTLAGATRILGACGVRLSLGRVERPALFGAAERLRDLEPGAAATLFERLGRSGSRRPVGAVFARDTRMTTPFDAEAFGRANTRGRGWLADSVWLTLPLRDEAIALAHELWHVLANSGEHVEADGNLMRSRTTGDNVALSAAQCAAARDVALGAGLAVPAR